MSNNQTIKERLIYFIKSQNIGQGKFENLCGLSNGYVNNIRKSIQPDKVQKIALRFPYLNTGWLMTGEGEMLKNSGNIIQGNMNEGTVQSGGSNQNINISLPSEGEQKIIRPDGTVEIRKSDSSDTKMLEEKIKDLERLIASKDEMIDLLKQMNNKQLLKL